MQAGRTLFPLSRRWSDRCHGKWEVGHHICVLQWLIIIIVLLIQLPIRNRHARERPGQSGHPDRFQVGLDVETVAAHKVANGFFCEMSSRHERRHGSGVDCMCCGAGDYYLPSLIKQRCDPVGSTGDFMLYLLLPLRPSSLPFCIVYASREETPLPCCLLSALTATQTSGCCLDLRHCITLLGTYNRNVRDNSLDGG